jgi:glycosyltransferase involved in cell wall biosynthesis
MMKNNRKPNILMIAPFCFPPAQPEALVNAKLAIAMIEAGWHVDIVTEGIHNEQWYPFQPQAWLALNGSLHIVPAMARNLKNKLFCAFRSSSIIAGGVRWAIPAFECIQKLVGNTSYDLILSRANPDSAHLPAMMIHKRTGIPWIANWNDPMPWKKFPPPYGQGPQAKMRLIDIIYYKKIVKQCSWHTFPCERLRQYMISYLPDIGMKTSIIPHIALDRHCRPAVPHQGFTLCYAGTLRGPRNPEVLLEGLQRFISHRPYLEEISMQFFADQSDKVIELAKEKGLDKIVKIERTQPYEKIIDLLPAKDVLVIIEAPVDEGIFLPSKFVDYVQTGRPILALSPVAGTLNDILSQHGGGLAVDGQAPEAVADAIEILYSHWTQGTLDDKFSSRQLFPLFSQKSVLDQYLKLIELFSKGQ